MTDSCTDDSKIKITTLNDNSDQMINYDHETTTGATYTIHSTMRYEPFEQCERIQNRRK